MTRSPLYRSILSALLASGMHPDNAIDRAEETYLAIRDRYPPEPSPYPLLGLFLGLLLLTLIAYLLLR
jgi:hypothetical protein